MYRRGKRENWLSRIVMVSLLHCLAALVMGFVGRPGQSMELVGRNGVGHWSNEGKRSERADRWLFVNVGVCVAWSVSSSYQPLGVVVAADETTHVLVYCPACPAQGLRDVPEFQARLCFLSREGRHVIGPYFNVSGKSLTLTPVRTI